MSEWQPIETAPKDGTTIQVWIRGSIVPVAVYYVSKNYLLKEYGDPDYMDEGFYYSLGYPFDELLPEIPLGDLLTHWMPLPNPPSRN